MTTTALITGSASGIGLELCKQLKARGCHVIAVCRSVSPELRGLDVEVIDGIDLTKPNDVLRVKERIQGRTLHWLMNNAGLFENETLGAIDYAQIHRQLEINTIAPLRLTEALATSLTQGSKIGITTSRMGSIEDNTSGGYYGYRLSKAAVNMIGKSLAVDLKPRGVAVALLHPGYVKTKMTGFNGEITPEVSAQGLIKVMDALSLETSGGFWHTNGQRLPW